MTKITVSDVAACILLRTGAVSAMKLQKLCYYAQAWSLVWDEAPLYPEVIEAWVGGPVCPALYAVHKGRYTVAGIPGGKPDVLTTDQRETVEAVLKGYGHLTAQQLSTLTHSEDPWKNARRGLPATARGHAEITIDAMQEFYSSLVDREDAEVVA